ncbi:MAG: hypothetical protein R2788_16770 [Saprospiraceae bacterium]
MRLGVIDCGTNTFHLLVIDVDDDQGIRRVHKERRYVRIGQEGLDTIGETPFRRGVDCLADYKKLVNGLGVQRLKVFGTEALRRASNRQDFIKAVEEETGIQVQIISGEEEARFIHLGVLQAVPPFAGKGLIMDIGGGSVEFIIADGKEVYWSKSFPIGVQVLFSTFHQTDPLSEGQLSALEAFLEETLAPLFDALTEHQTPVLMGASGSFEVVESFHGHVVTPDTLFTEVLVTDYYKMHHQVVRSSLSERYAMEQLPNERAELIVVAFALIHFILKKANIHKIITSAYAMKEGVLFEMMNEAPGFRLA